MRRRKKHHWDAGAPFSAGISAPSAGPAKFEKMPEYDVQVADPSPPDRQQSAPRMAAAVDMGQGPVQQPHQPYNPINQPYTPHDIAPKVYPDFGDVSEKRGAEAAETQEDLSGQERLGGMYFDDPPIEAPVVGSGGLSKKPGYGAPRNDLPYDPHVIRRGRKRQRDEDEPLRGYIDPRGGSAKRRRTTFQLPPAPPQVPPPDKPGRPDGGGGRPTRPVAVPPPAKPINDPQGPLIVPPTGRPTPKVPRLPQIQAEPLLNIPKPVKPVRDDPKIRTGLPMHPRGIIPRPAKIPTRSREKRGRRGDPGRAGGRGDPGGYGPITRAPKRNYPNTPYSDPPKDGGRIRIRKSPDAASTGARTIPGPLRIKTGSPANAKNGWGTSSTDSIRAASWPGGSTKSSSTRWGRKTRT
jgi:hypothetical protein